MSERSTSTSAGDIGIFGFLGLMFVGLKLTHYIDWSWWWVTAPFWIPAAAVIVFLVVSLVVMVPLAAIGFLFKK